MTVENILRPWLGHLPYTIRVLCFCSLVWMLWFVCFALPFDIIKILNRHINLKFFDWLTWKRIVHIAIVFVILATIFSIHQATAIKCKNYEIHSSLVPIEADGYRIMLVSDLHFGTLSAPKTVELTEKYIREYRPNLLLNAGDLLDSQRIPDVSYLCTRLATAIKGIPDGAYGVTGNHDFFATSDLCVKYHELSGIRLLGSENDTLEASPEPWLRIAGIKYQRKKFNNDSDLPTPPAKSGLFNILLKHIPELPQDEGDKNYQLMLCGHTHGGQIFPFNLFVNIKNEFVTGKFYCFPESCSYYICQGTGCWGPPMRFWVPPEIVIFTLRHQ